MRQDFNLWTHLLIFPRILVLNRYFICLYLTYVPIPSIIKCLSKTKFWLLLAQILIEYRLLRLTCGVREGSDLGVRCSCALELCRFLSAKWRINVLNHCRSTIHNLDDGSKLHNNYRSFQRKFKIVWHLTYEIARSYF